MPRTHRIRPSPATAAVLALAFGLLAWLVLARHGAPYAFDTRPHRWSVAHRPHGLLTAARTVTHAGTGPYPYLVAAAGGWLAGGRGRAARAGDGVPAALLAVFALLAEQAVRGLLMVALHRPRPPVADWATAASGHSFPSGHSASSAMAAGLLAWGVLRARPGRTGRLLAAVCALYPLAVGCTRVYLGVHWPSDVLGGWLYAGCCLALVLPPLTAYVRRNDGRPGGWKHGRNGGRDDGGDGGGHRPDKPDGPGTEGAGDAADRAGRGGQTETP